MLVVPPVAVPTRLGAESADVLAVLLPERGASADRRPLGAYSRILGAKVNRWQALSLLNRVRRLPCISVQRESLFAALDELQVRIDFAKPDDYADLCEALNRFAEIVRTA